MVRYQSIGAILVLLVRVATLQPHFATPLEASFGRALLGFNPFLHQPPPPAYPVYVALGKLVNFFVHDTLIALLVLSVVASVATFVLLARAFPTWIGFAIAFAVALFPLPTRPLPDTVAIAFFAVALSAWVRATSPAQASEVARLHTILLAATVGVLPQSILFVLPFVRRPLVFAIALFVMFLQTIQNIELRRLRAFIEASFDLTRLFDRPAMWAIAALAAGAVTYHLSRGKAHDLPRGADVQRGGEH